ncbi:MAG: HD domain-containing protein [bacterium]|nr:HD domain-containing protein [bacterium]
MKPFIRFFTEVGKLRKVPRRGGVLIGSKSPSSITDHLFRVALMALVLGREKKGNLNMTKVLEMALVHDLCELYTGDKSPYDHNSILPGDKKKWPELFDRWPRLTTLEKKRKSLQKYKSEGTALDKLLKGLPPDIKREIKNSWAEYEKGLTKEARFMKQINRLETLLSALEYGREEKIRVYKSWWVGSKERIDDPTLIKFMDSLAKEFPSKR